LQLAQYNPNPRPAVRLPLTAARLAFPNAELKKCLRAVFCQFGTILDVVLCKALKLRGQAWVVFSTVEEATEAKAMMEGFPLYEKPLVRARVRRGQPPHQLTQRARATQRVEFARSKSDVVAKADGSFQPRPAYDKAKRMAEVKGAAERDAGVCWAACADARMRLRSRGKQEAESQRGCRRRCAAVYRVCCAAAPRAHHRAHARAVPAAHHGPPAVRRAGRPSAAAQDSVLAGALQQGGLHAAQR